MMAVQPEDAIFDVSGSPDFPAACLWFGDFLVKQVASMPALLRDAPFAIEHPATAEEAVRLFAFDLVTKLGAVLEALPTANDAVIAEYRRRIIDEEEQGED
jgi:hypothetical protein